MEHDKVGHMKHVLVAVDDETAARLEGVAPGRSRKRSEFIRTAIRRALDEIAERKMEEAYLARPDDRQEYLDPAVWEAHPPGFSAPAGRGRPRVAKARSPR